MHILISGGYPNKDYYKQEEGYQFKEAFIKILDWDTATVVREMVYKSPPEHRASNNSILFKSGSVHKGEFIVPTDTEIVFVNINSLEINRIISLNCFTDLHHVTLNKNLLYIANTGIEAVQILDFHEEITNEYHLASSPTWKKLDKGSDLRFVSSTKPHYIHVNHVFFIDDEPWCTRLLKYDAISLNYPDRKINLRVGKGGPHDGLVSGDFIYFTLTGGYIVVVNKHSLKIDELINLNKISDGKAQLGWCRGLDVVDDTVFVGFTRIRNSLFSEYGSWILKNVKKLPA